MCVVIDMGTEEHQDFSKIEKERLLQEVIDPMQCEGLRTLCLAYRDFPAQGKFSVPSNFHRLALNSTIHCKGKMGKFFSFLENEPKPKESHKLHGDWVQFGMNGFSHIWYIFPRMQHMVLSFAIPWF